MAISEKALTPIKNKRRNYYYWGEEEIDLLKKYHDTKTTKELMKITGRSFQSITEKACKLGLKIKPIIIKWTDEDVKFLHDNHKKMKVKQIANHLNREAPHIYTKLKKEGLSFKRVTRKEPVKVIKKKVIKIIETKETYTEVVKPKMVIERSLEKLTKKRDEVLKALNGRYNEELYSELNSLNTSINQLKQKK